MKDKSNMMIHSERELKILRDVSPDSVVLDFEDEINALCDAFGKSGQSGGSAPFVRDAIVSSLRSLLSFETISPLTGEDSEWVDISDINEGEENIMKYQNKRDSRVFKQSDGRAYFIDAIVFDGDDGGRFVGNDIDMPDGSKIGSVQYIKSFPFTPKTFFVDVKDYRWTGEDEKVLDPDGDWWTHSVVNPSQVKKVFEYYDRK